MEVNPQTAMCNHAEYGRVSSTKQQATREHSRTTGLYNQIHISATGTGTTYNTKRLTGYQNEQSELHLIEHGG